MRIPIPNGAIISLAFLALMPLPGGDHGFGPVTPVAIEEIPATRHDGKAVDLRRELMGQPAAIQFTFTNCRTACPLLGALFQSVDRRLGNVPARLITISVDPARDTPDRMARWLREFEAGPRWIGLRMEPRHLAAALRLFGLPPGEPAGHSTQIFLIDAGGNYVARTTRLPLPATVAGALSNAGTAASTNGPSLRLKDGGASGARMFSLGEGLAATIDGTPLPPHAARCANCHGHGGSGGAEGNVHVPAITREALLASLPRRGGPPSAFTNENFCRSLQTGVDPAGVKFSSVMPKFELDTAACGRLWRHLLTLP
jgi:cytochrome oxidase Cu insertion factor (SCO1/SenC/PrrC family)